MEIWKDVIGYENLYSVSNLGNVMAKEKKQWNNLCNCWSNRRQRILIKHICMHGYEFIRLSKNNTPKAMKVHRLVAIHFIPNDKNKPCINHKDGNKKNNCVENLEWVTQSENVIHAFATGLRVTTEKEKDRLREMAKNRRTNISYLKSERNATL